MIRLWLVLTILGNVGASWGPLAYDVDECHVRVAELTERLDDLKYPLISGPLKVERKDVKYDCILAMVRPTEGKPVQ